MTTQHSPNPSDEDLWDRLCQQQVSAFEELELLVKEVCAPVLRSRKGSAGGGEDFFQDVLVSVWEFSGKKHRRPTNLRAFLKWRAKGVLQTYSRELEKRRRERSIDTGDPSPDGGSKQTDIMVMKEMSETYKKCREGLSGSYTAVWKCHFEKRLEPRAIAIELKLQVGTVAVTLHRAKDQLLMCLQRKGMQMEALK